MAVAIIVNARASPARSARRSSPTRDEKVATMHVKRSRRAGAVLALLTASSLLVGTTPPAQAAPAAHLRQDALGPIGDLLGPLLDPVLDPLLDPVLGGIGSVTGPLTDAACDLVDGIGGDSPLPGCPFDVSFRTRFADGASGVTRIHAATVGVPTSLDVDGDAAPDVIATLGLADLGQVGLSVSLHPLQSGPLPVAVEAVLSDIGPVLGQLPAENLAFGYDARADRAPREFGLGVRLAGLALGELDLQLAQTDPGSRIAVVGELFDGTLAAPEEPVRVSADYLTSPERARLQVGLADPRRDLSATLTQPSRGRVVVTAVVDRDGPDADTASDTRATATVTIDQVPGSLSIDLLRPQDGVIEVDYDASDRIDSLQATLRLDVLPVDDSRDQQLEVVLTDLAPVLDLRVDSAAATAGSSGTEDRTLVTLAGDPSSAPGDLSVGSVVARTRDFLGIPDLDVSVADLPRSLSLCFDRGAGCRRAEGRARPEGGGCAPLLSVDAVSSHTDGFVTVDARIVTDENEILVQDLRLRELAIDVTRGPDDRIRFTDRNLPRIAVFVDSDDQPFTLGNASFGPLQEFRLGTTSAPARAQDRFLWVKEYGIGGGDGLVGQETAGTLHCGGARVLRVIGLNLLDLGGLGLSPVDLCNS